MNKISIKLFQADFDNINELINKICQDRYSETAVIPSGTKNMLRNIIIENLDKYQYEKQEE